MSFDGDEGRESSLMTDGDDQDMTEYDKLQYRHSIHEMETGDEDAKTEVAFFKLSGRGDAEIDADGAVALLEERVKDRDDVAMWILGLCYEYGIGTEKDIERAELLYNQSRDLGNGGGKLLSLNRWNSRGTKEMKMKTSDEREILWKCLFDVASVAPWTTLDLFGKNDDANHKNVHADNIPSPLEQHAT